MVHNLFTSDIFKSLCCNVGYQPSTFSSITAHNFEVQKRANLHDKYFWYLKHVFMLKWVFLHCIVIFTWVKDLSTFATVALLYWALWKQNQTFSLCLEAACSNQWNHCSFLLSKYQLPHVFCLSLDKQIDGDWLRFLSDVLRSVQHLWLPLSINSQLYSTQSDVKLLILCIRIISFHQEEFNSNCKMIKPHKEIRVDFCKKQNVPIEGED